MNDELVALVREATVRCFFGGNEEAAKFLVSPTSNGSNNWVFYVDVEGEQRYVLRIYNNGRSRTRVLAEHGMLEALNHCPGLSFATPRLKHVPVSNDGSSHVVTQTRETKNTMSSFIELSDGSYACFFYLLKGVYVGSKPNFMHSMGKVTSELMGTLQGLYDKCIQRLKSNTEKEESTATYTRDTYDHGPAPYYDLWNVHSAITRDAFFSFCEDSAQLQLFSTDMETLLHEITALEQWIPRWKQELKESQGSAFPSSFVHGDLVTDNFLCDEKDERVTAVLDFEFVGVDWRIMELATCISKFPEEADPMINLRLFIGGFREARQVELEKREIDALPNMISLRVLSNVIYFVGRAISGEADFNELTERIPGYCCRLKWLGDEVNRAALTALFD